MDSVPYFQVLKGIARRVSIDPETQLTAAQAEELTDYANEAFRRGWEQEWWPDWTPTQPCKMTVPREAAQCSGYSGPNWDWRLWPGPGPYIDLETGGAAPMGTIQCVFLRDPQGRPQEKPIYDFAITQRGIELPRPLITHAWRGLDQRDGTPIVWVTFRLNPAQFTSAEWAAETQYKPGDLVLRDGECWEANEINAGTDPARSAGASGILRPPWAIQVFPKLLERYVVAQAASEWLALRDRTVSSQAQAGKASDAMEEELNRRGIQQSQNRRYRIRMR
jgi:hypothetical protein